MDLPILLRTARLQLIADAFDAAGFAGKLLFYGGARPAPGAVPAGALQVTVLLAYPSATVDSAVLELTTGSEGVRVDVATLTWARFVDGNDAWCGDVSVSGTGGGGEVVVSNVNGFVGGIVRLLAGYIGE